MGFTLPLTAEGQKREKNNGKHKEGKIGGIAMEAKGGGELGEAGEREESEGTRGEISRLPEVSGTAPVSPV